MVELVGIEPTTSSLRILRAMLQQFVLTNKK